MMNRFRIRLEIVIGSCLLIAAIAFADACRVAANWFQEPT